MQLHPSKTRIASVDILRGLVMIIMALDHVREFWSVAPFRPEDLTQTTGALFFTRWITHLCAPVFAFLTGVSIYFQLLKLKSKRQVSFFLLKRGVWLILAQLLIINFIMQFSFNLMLLEVIWVLGWSMIIMAGLIWSPDWAIATFAFILIAGHNLLPNIQPVDPGIFVLALLHNSPTVVPLPDFPTIIIAYTIVPWVGVVAAGFVAGKWFTLPTQLERYVFLNTGLFLLLVFMSLRYFNIYGDPSPWEIQSRGEWFTAMSFINVTKYPPSLLFLTLMIGIAFLILWIISLTQQFIPSVIRVFGQVPFFFYITHMALVVTCSLVWTYIEFGTPVNLAFISSSDLPSGYEPDLTRTYLVWAAVLVVLYFPCKWFGQYKIQRGGWTSYL